MKSAIYLLPLVVLFVAGCDTMNWQQYRISGVAASSPGATKLRATLQTIADQTGLRDTTQDSHEPLTLVFYTQPEVRNFALILAHDLQTTMFWLTLWVVLGRRHQRTSRPRDC